VITGPGGEGRVAFSYRPELAEAVAVALTEPGHEGVLNIGTPESVTLAELARIASEVTGDAYRYEPLAPEEWQAKRLALGRKDWEVEAGLSSYEALRAGEFDVVTDDYARLTGQRPLTVRELIERQRDEMPLRRA
jgi:NAD(P)H dehydrogenase (quinone)